MTKEEIIEMAKTCLSRDVGGIECSKSCPFYKSDQFCTEKFAQYIVDKENEPAPSANDTSSTNKNITILDDSTKLQICQEKIADIKENLLLIYEGMTNEEQRAWELG